MHMNTIESNAQEFPKYRVEYYDECNKLLKDMLE
jgi:hypothetical protein